MASTKCLPMASPAWDIADAIRDLTPLGPTLTQCEIEVDVTETGAFAPIVDLMAKGPQKALIRQTIEGSAFVMARTAKNADSAHDWRRILTERELGVLAHVAEGLTNKQIASRLWLSEQTIKFHVRNVYKKLGVSSRTEALRFAHEHDLVNVLV